MGAYTYFKTKIFDWHQERLVQAHLYAHPQFKKADLALLRSYRGKNPYRMSIRYLKEQKAPNIYTYGETPIPTMAKIAYHFGIGPEERVIDMGAGRGRAALFLGEYVGCRVRAYELIPDFAKNFQFSERVEMLQEDMFQADFSWATTIFLYGTLLSDEEIHSLLPLFQKKQKIITVSYSLSEYSGDYQTKQVISGRFPWGETEVYWNERII